MLGYSRLNWSLLKSFGLNWHLLKPRSNLLEFTLNNTLPRLSIYNNSKTSEVDSIQQKQKILSLSRYALEKVSLQSSTREANSPSDSDGLFYL